MSGPIVRRYGFPNHEKGFGFRPLEHGVKDSQGSPNPPKTEDPAETPIAQGPPEGPEAAKTTRTG